MRPRQTPGRLAAAFERAHRAGRLTRHELGALTLPETRQLLGPASTTARRPRSTRTAAAIRSTSSSSPARWSEHRAPLRGPRGLARSGVKVPPAVVAALTEELGAALGRRAPRTGRCGRRGRPVRARAGGRGGGSRRRPPRSRRSTSCCAATSCDHRRPASFPLPPPARAQSGLRRLAGRLAARRARALRRGAGRRAEPRSTARAHHVERSAPPRRRGRGRGPAGGRDGGGTAHARRRAARWFAAALRLLGEGCAAERASRAPDRAGRRTGGDRPVRRSPRRPAREHSQLLRRRRDGAARLQLTAACAGIEQLLGRHEEAHARLVGALEGLDDPASPQAVALMITLALDAFYRQARADSRDWGARALEVARPLGDEPLIAAAAGRAGPRVRLRGSARRRRALSRGGGRADRRACPTTSSRSGSTPSPTSPAPRCTWIASTESAAHGRARARRRARDRTGLPPADAHAGLGHRDRHAGPAAARQPSCWTAAIEASRLAGNDQTLAWDLLNRAFVDVHRGEMDCGDRGCRGEHGADARDSATASSRRTRA